MESSIATPFSSQFSQTKQMSPPPTLDTGQTEQRLLDCFGSASLASDKELRASDGSGRATPASNSLCGSDVENFTGKIVYNPDGSAYIIEGSDGSDVESEVGSIIPLHSEGSIVERAGPQVSSVGNNSSSSSSTATTTFTSAIPQVVSAFHISRSSTALQGIYSALYGGSGAAGGFPAASLLQENLKVPEVPIMHSYRVYTLKDKKRADGECGLAADSDRKSGETNADSKENAGSSTLTVPVKPILMCFICKLSFGFAKSFVAHGMAEHNLSLNDEENELLQQKNTSAIIQGVGKEKEPLLSFLEPRNRAPQPLLPNSLAGLAANLNQLSAAAAAAAASSGSASGSSAPSASSSLHQQFQQKLEAAQQRLIAAAAQAAAAAAMRQGQQSSVTSSFMKNTISTTAASCNESPRPSSNESLNLVLPKNYDGNNDSGDNDLRFANRMTPPNTSGEQDNSLTPELADLANLEKIAKAAAAAIQQECDLPTTACNTQMQSQSPVGYAMPSTSPKSPGSSVGMAITSSPLTLIPQSQLHQSAVSSPFVCAQHPDGKTNGVECPKCEMILGSSRSLGGHMTMMHSRNSCKTLKCPKCNWHYKYQETLEIHMKEKHPENEMNCIYCLTNQPHPRLARGETYTCGYKPYRCEVCNYSTTTKGNLSIHMQSDKHINNVQELQNGNIPAEHLLQSQALAVAAAAAANKTPNATPAPSGSNASSPGVPSSGSATGAGADKSSPVGVPVTAPSQTATAPQSKPKATWRCDVCNYETNVARNLRIHMTSEKHTHNMMVLQQNVKHMQQLNALQQVGILGGQDPMFQFHPGLFAALAGAGSQSGNGGIPGAENLQPEAALADMAYNHALLMMASQHQQQRAVAAMIQQQQQQQQQSAQQQQKAAIAAAAAALGGVNAAAAAAALSAFGPGSNIPGGQPIVDLEHPDPSLRFDSVPYDENCRLFQCCVCTTYTCDTIEALSQHIQLDRTRLREDEVLMAVGGSYICKLCSYKTNLKANFQLHCKTDKHLQRLQQVNHIKEGGQRTDWKLKYVNVSNPIQVRCNLCDYYTNSIHKLQLHTSNPRHEASSRVFLHLQLTETLMKTNAINSSGEQKNGYYYYCALCQHSTRSMISLVHHIHSIKHLQSENLRQLKLQQSSAQKTLDEEIRDLFQVKEYLLTDKIVFSDGKSTFLFLGDSPPGALPAIATRDGLPSDIYISDELFGGAQQILDEMSGQSPASLPSTSTPSSTPTIDSNAVTDSSMLKQALLEQQLQGSVSSGPHHKSDTSQEMSNSCPYCSYSNASDVKLQMHVLSQHSKQMQTKKEQQSQLLCPLCQQAFDQRSKLELHLMEIHNVTKEGVQRLMLIVDQAGDLMSGLSRKDESKNEDNDDSSSTGGNDNIDGKSDCSGDSSSREDFDQQAAKFLKLGGGVPAAVSDRHVYKYRCNQCSLAFKTLEKLQLHSQYHLIRAATQCVLCGRSFRSVEALQKHVETTHQDMTEEELDVYRQSLANNPLLLSGRNGGGILDPSTTELLKKESNRLEELTEADDEAMDLVMNCAQGNRCSTSPAVINEMNETANLDETMESENDLKSSATAMVASGEDPNSLEDYLNSQSVAEDSYNDPSRKYKCHRCKVAFTRQSYLTSHNKTLLHRKGEKLSYPMEKYLDPNRPYKCDICKESFTQKNILLVHYNSVSHLHKLKQAMKENANVNDASATQATISTAVPTSISNEVATSNGNSTTLSANNAANANDLEKKPFRCNICKVAYNLGSTLDIHIRSVLHQTRASKLHDLAISGQIDLSQPLIERPDNQSESQASVASNNPTSTSPPKSDAKPNSPSPSSTPKSVAELAFPVGLSLAEQQLQQQLQQQAAALNLAAGQQLLLGTAGTQMPTTGTGLFPCQRCGAIFTSQEANLQHSQICCFFGPPSLTRELFKNQQQSAKEQQQSQDVSMRSVTKYYNAPVCRTKPPVYKHLLETWGFEIAMQFNEYHQKRRKPEEKKEENTDKSAEAAMEKNQESEKRRFNLPEINRSKCDICHKEFSSIWVLKAHKEEIHKQIVALEIVEDFADEYRKEYERRIQNNGVDDDNIASTSDQVISASTTPVTAMDGQQVNTSNLTNQTSNSTTAMISASAGVTTTASNNAVNTQSDMNAASQMAAQLQFSQLLMSMGLAGMGMPMGMNVPFAAAMGLHPPMLPLMMAPHLDPVMAAFNHQAAAGLVNASATTPTPTPPNLQTDSNFFAAQQKLLQQQQQQLTAAQQQKRARTRITDDQLKILRQYFDINNSPTEEQLQEMSEKSGLPLKVIKHWFRNTLFKERQRNKDSPYNFNNPPSTFLNLEEYEKTGEAKVISIDEALKEVKKENVKDDEMKSKHTEIAVTAAVEEMHVKQEQRDSFCDVKSAKSEYDFTSSDDDCGGVKKEDVKQPEMAAKKIQEQIHEQSAQIQSQRESFDYAKSFTMSPHSESSVSSISTNDTSSQSGQQSQQLFANLPAFAASLTPLGANPLQLALDAAHRSQVASVVASTSSSNTTSAQSNANSNSAPAPGKRANRTRFTDYQIKVLQEFFETNAYPKDDDLEYLSKLLNLSPRVIVVWFQNARQKARKVYENQPPVTPEEDNPGKFQRTPGLNYQCKKCMQVFQRYYELIKHQKSACFKDENPLAVQIKAAQEARQQQSASPGAASGCASNSSAPGSNSEKTSSSQPSQQNGAFRCEKCSLVFPRFDLWREHQLVHLMNPNLFPSYPPTSPFGILQYEAQQNPNLSAPATTSQSQPQPNVPQPNPSQSPVLQPNTAVKRKVPEDEDSLDSHSCAGSQSGVSSDQPRDKRLRTTILPEQLDYLYQKYQIESNPSRKMLENIAKEVGLKKRVVQVWFQNTRARERKGQFRAHQQVIHKRCPFCRALFKARSALESHLATRHADQYTKGDINIDALPDGDPNEDTSPIEEIKNALTPEMLQNQMKQYYESSLKKYMDELGNNACKELPVELSSNIKAALEKTLGDAPLDLSKPVDLSKSLNLAKFTEEDTSYFDDVRSEPGDLESESDENMVEGDADCYSNPTSPGLGSTTSSVTSPSISNCQSKNSPSSQGANKRFRTQMTTVQLKVMKSIFADYKTPSMAECELLGREVGLPKRVIQVWFQNARAKEKKAKLAFVKTFGQEIPDNLPKAPEECKICNVKYNLKFSSTSMQDHLFSKKHIEALKLHIDSVKKFIEGPDDSSTDFPAASSIVLPPVLQTAAHATNNATNTSDESLENRSQSAANLMQQLQMMGLAGLQVPGLQTETVNINGGTKKKSTESVVKGLKKVSNTDKSKSEPTTTNSGSNECENVANATNPFNYVYSGLENYYAAAGATAAFLHPTMYNATASASATGTGAAVVNNSAQSNIHHSSNQQHSQQQQIQQMQPHLQQASQQAMHNQHQQQQQLHQNANAFYVETSNMYGTPLSLLQLPSSCLPEITAKLNQPGVNSVRFFQDGRSVEEIRHLLHDNDVKVAQEVDIEVGFTCKKCHMTYPAEVLCLGHQRASCFAKQSADIKATLKLVQIHIECRLCRERFASAMDYKFHCESQRHKELMSERQMKCMPKIEAMNAVNGGLTQNAQINNSNEVSNLFINGNDSQVSVNLLNYLTKEMANSAAVYSNSTEVRHCQQ